MTAPIPGWALVDDGTLRLAGYLTDIDVAGERFLALSAGPGEPPKRLINARRARVITPVPEGIARQITARQWPTTSAAS